MKLLEKLMDLILTPIDKISESLDLLKNTCGEWLDGVMYDIGINATMLFIEGVAVFAVGYTIYCAFRVMCCGGKDEVFSEYINKTMIAGICYFFAKCGGVLLLKALGV